MQAEKRRLRRKAKIARRRRDRAYKPVEKGSAQPISFHRLMALARRHVVQPVLGPRTQPAVTKRSKAEDTKTIVARIRAKVEKGEVDVAKDDPSPNMSERELPETVHDALRPEGVLHQRMQGAVLQDTSQQEED